MDDIRAIEAQAQNGALTSHQVIDGGHDGSFDSAVRTIHRRRPRLFRDTDSHIGFIGSTEVAPFAMRLQL